MVGFRVSRVQGLGFRVYDLGFRVQGLCKVEGLGSKGCRIHDPGPTSELSSGVSLLLISSRVAASMSRGSFASLLAAVCSTTGA